MQDILIRAAGFVMIILLGFVLRRVGFFQESAFDVLSKITLRITLPASVLVSFAQQQIDPAMLAICGLGFLGGIVYLAVAFLINLRGQKNQRAFDVLNLPGYNIGLFTMPFVQSFLGPLGVVTTSLFDVGNAVVCLGGSFGIACSVKEGGGFSFKRVGKALITSVPFVTYLIAVILNLLHVRLPAPVIAWADIIKSANAFLAMLMIGVGFKLSANRKQLGYVLKMVLIRYGVAVALALLFYYLLPFDLEVRKALVVLVFSPIGAAVPAFTKELKADVGLSSALNSICILISIVIMVVLFSVM